MAGAGVMGPLSGTGTLPTTFRCDYKTRWIRGKRFSDELFGYVRTVGIGRVDKIHAEFNCVSQSCNCAVVVFRRSPDPFTRDPHGPIAEPIDSEVSAEVDCPCSSGSDLLNHLLSLPFGCPISISGASELARA